MVTVTSDLLAVASRRSWSHTVNVTEDRRSVMPKIHYTRFSVTSP